MHNTHIHVYNTQYIIEIDVHETHIKTTASSGNAFQIFFFK